MPAQAAEVCAALDRLEERLAPAGVEIDDRHDVRLVAEETLINVVRHGAGGTDSLTIDLRCDIEEHAVRIEVHDNGPAFDPLSHPAPDLDAPLEERPIGGLGVYMVRTLADEASYRRSEGRNELRLVLRRGSRKKGKQCH
jgi:anti-sigma regulatory factor (Ser/Thr protein kinase)